MPHASGNYSWLITATYPASSDHVTLFFDTTRTYFERDEEEDGQDAFRRYGHSKDHRPDLP